MNAAPAWMVLSSAVGLPQAVEPDSADQAGPGFAAVPGPTREATLVLPNHRPAPESQNPAAVIAASAAAIAVLMVVLAVLIWRRSGDRDPGAIAFATLSRRMRLKGEDRRIVEQLARAHGRATPAAILLSEHAFREAVERLCQRRNAPKKGAAPALDAVPSEFALLSLLRRVHGGLSSA